MTDINYSYDTTDERNFLRIRPAFLRRSKSEFCECKDPKPDDTLDEGVDVCVRCKKNIVKR